MGTEENRLREELERLVRARNEYASAILSECGVPEITGRQIRYLKVIDDQGEGLTFGQLAAITRNSRPTITEMVNRFVSMECVYREQSPHDGRVLYIRLTEKGRKVARAEESAVFALVARLRDSLDENDLDILIRILRKVR